MIGVANRLRTMDLVRLRQLVGDVLDGLASMWTHREIGQECERLGLPSPPPAGDGSTRERVSRSLAVLADADLPMVAERIMAGTMPLSAGPAARHAIDDVLWAGRGPEIPRRTRREIINLTPHKRRRAGVPALPGHPTRQRPWCPLSAD